MKTLLIPILSICALTLGSCGHDTPQRDHRPLPDRDEQPDPGQRPGLGEIPNPFDRELKDAVWRFAGRAATLRYDRGGVLFTSGPGGTVGITDLDGATEVKAVIGPPSADSVCTAAVTINGRPLGILHTRMHARTAEAVWYEITDTDSARHVLVTPP